MEEWKVRQEIYHRIRTDFTDDMKNFDIEINPEKINIAILYFKTTNIGWIWPAKSYVVGICYSKWLSQRFGDDPIKYLDDPDLLYGNDPYFTAYSKDKFVYDSILASISGWNFDETQGVVPQIKKYFLKEFLFDEETDSE